MQTELELHREKSDESHHNVCEVTDLSHVSSLALGRRHVIFPTNLTLNCVMLLLYLAGEFASGSDYPHTLYSLVACVIMSARFAACGGGANHSPKT